MSRRRTAHEVAQLLREADRDLAKGLTVPDICRKLGIAADDLLSVAAATRPGPGRHRSPVPRAGARGRPSQEAGGRVAPRQADAPGHRKKKVVSPDQQRAAADYLGERYRVSQRRICRVMGRSRSGLRYRPSAGLTRNPCARRSNAWRGDIRATATGGSMRSWSAGVGRSTSNGSGGSGTAWGCAAL